MVCSSAHFENSMSISCVLHLLFFVSHRNIPKTVLGESSLKIPSTTNRYLPYPKKVSQTTSAHEGRTSSPLPGNFQFWLRMKSWRNPFLSSFTKSSWLLYIFGPGPTGSPELFTFHLYPEKSIVLLYCTAGLSQPVKAESSRKAII